MPNYASPFMTAGAGAGALGGGGLGALLGLLEPLDYPRQAVYGGVVNPLYHALGGDPDRDIGHASDLLSAWGMDPDSPWTKALGLAGDVATDPLSYLGALGGGSAGRLAGQAAGRSLEELALARGPQYLGGVEKLAPLLEAGGDVAARARGMMADPQLSRLLGEIPPRTELLGSGLEGTALRNLEDPAHVIRIAGGPGSRDWERGFVRGTPESLPPRAALDIPEMLAPARDLPIGPYRVQHNPFVEMAGPPPDPRYFEMQSAGLDLAEAARARGFPEADVHPGNIGRLGEEPRYVIADTGGLRLPPGMPAPAETVPQRTGGPVSNLLLNLLGSNEAVQREISAGVQGGGANRGLFLPGAAAEGPAIQAQAVAHELGLARQVRDMALQAAMAARQVGQPIPAWALQTLEQEGGRIENAKALLGQAPGGPGTPFQAALGQMGTNAVKTNPDLAALIEAEFQRRQGVR